MLQSHMAKEGLITKAHVIKIVGLVKKILSKEGNLLRLQDPITVVGDVHGQYYDFMKIIEVGKDPSKNKYIFLGDFVDRGNFSVEVLLLIFSLKV